MLILTDSNDLKTDRNLSPEEGVAQLKESNLKLSAANRLPNQSLLEDTKAALGQPMLHTELIRRLEKLDKRLIIRDGGVQGAIQIRIADPLHEAGHRYVTGFYQGCLPEFSSVLTDENGRATREIRGWRTVLLVLVHAGALTYAQVKSAFGAPLGQRGILWQEQMQSKKI